MNSSASRCSFSGLLEANNNLPIDVVSLLRLTSTDDEAAQVSNSSSLESLTSLDNNQGSGGEDEDGTESGSTSCSEDSFEMSSTCGMETSPDTSPLRTTAKEEAEAANSRFVFLLCVRRNPRVHLHDPKILFNLSLSSVESLMTFPVF